MSVKSTGEGIGGSLLTFDPARRRASEGTLPGEDLQAKARELRSFVSRMPDSDDYRIQYAEAFLRWAADEEELHGETCFDETEPLRQTYADVLVVLAEAMDHNPHAKALYGQVLAWGLPFNGETKETVMRILEDAEREASNTDETIRRAVGDIVDFTRGSVIATENSA